MLLAIDTTTQLLSIALHDGERILAECSLSAGRRHSELLAPMIQQVMTQQDLSANELGALAVAVGPGSYTGTRIGVALAKGMAAVNDLPLVPVNTLDVIAAGQAGRTTDLPLIVTLPAGRKRAIWAEYRHQGEAWQETRPAEISAWQDLLATCSQPCLISGEIAQEGLQAITSAQERGMGIQLLPASQRLRRAGHLAEIAWQRLRGNQNEIAFRADQVMPVYLKSPG